VVLEEGGGERENLRREKKEKKVMYVGLRLKNGVQTCTVLYIQIDTYMYV
jgi:hypothetical protein